jgi:hypothetical protein
VIALFTGVLSSSSYLSGRAEALRIILYLLISVLALFLRLMVKDPSLIGDLRLISNSNFCYYLFEGSSLASMSLITT